MITMDTNSKHNMASEVDAEENGESLKCPRIPGLVGVVVDRPGWGDGTHVG